MNTDLNHAANANILPVLLKQLGRSKPSAFRILKLTWRALFNESLYKERIRIAQGAFAQVAMQFLVSIQQNSLFKHWSLNLCQILSSLQGRLEMKPYVNNSQKMMVSV
jgi:hypothetical protein